MYWWTVALCGLFGGFAVEGLDIWAAIRRHGHPPWRGREAPGLGIYLLAEGIRLSVGAGLAYVAWLSGEVPRPIGVVAIGVAAPLLIERLTKTIPLSGADEMGVFLPVPGAINGAAAEGAVRSDSQSVGES